MACFFWVLLLALLSVIPLLNGFAQATPHGLSFKSRRDDSVDFDVSVLASLGDSFASGPSAGDEYDDSPCRRFTEAAGPQLARSGEIKGPKPIDFNFIACSGARSKHIYEDPGARSSSGGGGKEKSKRSQANQLADSKKGFDMITLSIGGNDANFVDVLDRCVYRFKDVKGCAGCTPSVTHNDCSDDCSAALEELDGRLDNENFIPGLTRSIQAIFNAAPKAQLFMTGYPAFWNAETDACDKVSFKFGCINNSVLPLIRERRRRMNDLTRKLNGIIKRVVTATNPTGGGSIHFVDVDPYFDGHRFCEEGVDEPSYRNSDIWFYPFEYSTGGTLNISASLTHEANSDQCSSIWDDDGDAGDYFNCLLEIGMAADGITIDLGSMPNNVAGDDDLGDLTVERVSSGSGSLPAFLARIFHPTVKGMTAYKQALLGVYHGSVTPPLEPAVTPPREPSSATKTAAGTPPLEPSSATKTAAGTPPLESSSATKTVPDMPPLPTSPLEASSVTSKLANMPSLETSYVQM
ncbi:hypothetical protein N7481_010257 [Penicillium waksmanii]|uniref:uncharacterized protein n=1 Tax=Penicillium waksmanii TaxID=69791 RepID=UPI002548FCCA|nr:uncharacterized protein N7481_010257 [Penicillium waksmanii]KAJ5976550.1 hypothetical protein N7481_010257 [Penicillium waksmanii]